MQYVMYILNTCPSYTNIYKCACKNMETNDIARCLNMNDNQ